MEKALAINAKIVQIGRAAQRVPMYLESFQVRRAQAFGAQGHSGHENFPNVIRMVASGRLDLSPIITARYDLERRRSNAIAKSTKRTDGKIMVHPSNSVIEGTGSTTMDELRIAVVGRRSHRADPRRAPGPPGARRAAGGRDDLQARAGRCGPPGAAATVTGLRRPSMRCSSDERLDAVVIASSTSAHRRQRRAVRRGRASTSCARNRSLSSVEDCAGRSPRRRRAGRHADGRPRPAVRLRLRSRPST